MKQFDESNNKKGFDLDKMEKKNIFQVPDRYFDELPSVIQSKVVKPSKERRTAVFFRQLKYAIPVAAVLVIGFYFGVLNRDGGGSTDTELAYEWLDYESILSEVSADDLADYLSESEISTDEILASVSDDDFDDSFGALEILAEDELELEEMEDLLLEYELEGSLN